MDFFNAIPWIDYPLLLALGLMAGVMGGMLGVGGSIIMIPGMVFLLGQGTRPGFQQHTYMAAAMIANVAVAIPAARRHYRAKAINGAVFRWMLPAALLSILVGVYISNRPFFRGADGGLWLGRILAVFLLYEVIHSLWKVWRYSDDPRKVQLDPVITPPRSLGIGGAMGFLGGLTGIGGGLVAVPLQQIGMHLPLRNAIANSAAVMVASASLGALYKNATLYQNGVPWYAGVVLACLLAPSCWIGGHMGAILTHKLPIRLVRIVFVILMFASAWRLAAIRWPS